MKYDAERWGKLAAWCEGYLGLPALPMTEVRTAVDTCCALAGVRTPINVVESPFTPAAETNMAGIYFSPDHTNLVTVVHEAAHWILLQTLPYYGPDDGWFGHGPEWLATFRWLAKETLGMTLTKGELRSFGLPVWRQE